MRRSWLLCFCISIGLGADVAVSDEEKKLDPFPQVELKTALGDIIIELDNVRAPKSSANFLRYVNDGYYDGVVFHRVIKSYVIQAGRYDADYEEKSGLHDPIPCEWDNGLKNDRGMVGVARGAAADSGQAQFYINVVDSHILDQPWPASGNVGYAVFGRVVQGMDVVDAISQSKTVLEHDVIKNERWTVPEEPIVITKASVVPVSSSKRPEAVPVEGMKKIEVVTPDAGKTAKQEEAAEDGGAETPAAKKE